MNNVPASGSTIIFDRVPAGSYASTGEAYKVTHYGKGRTATINITSVARGSSTQDRAAMYARAAWRLA